MAANPDEWYITVYSTSDTHNKFGVNVNGKIVRGSIVGTTIWCEDTNISTSKNLFFTIYPDDGFRVSHVELNNNVDGTNKTLEQSLHDGTVTKYGSPNNGHQTYQITNPFGKIWGLTVVVEPLPHFNVKFDCDVEIDGLINGKLLSNPNLLDNWYFIGGGSQQGGGQFPINQRGQTEYTTAGYTIDRWATQDLDVKIFDNCIGIRIRENGTSNNILQVLDNPGYYNGKTLTFSMLCNGPAIMIIGINGSFNSTDFGNLGEYSLLHTSIEMPENITELIVHISCSNSHDSDYAKIFAAKVELGPVQTLAHQDAAGNWVLNDPPPNYALELAKCQRYQVVIDHGFLGIGHSIMDNTCLLIINTPEELAKVPTVILDGKILLQKLSSIPYVEVSQSNIYGVTPGNNTIRFACQNLTGMDVTAGSIYNASIGTNSKLIIDSNL